MNLLLDDGTFPQFELLRVSPLGQQYDIIKYNYQ